MSDSAFDDLPQKVVPRTIRMEDPTLTGQDSIKWIFIAYCERFIDNNANLHEVLQEFSGRFDDPTCDITQGQRILFSLSTLDGQVNNGGITQFFWNCPGLVFDVSGCLDAIASTELRESYNKALKSLVGESDNWRELRERASNDPKNFWAPFEESYDLLDLDWFDDAYFDRFGPALVVTLVDYVRANKDQFIEP